MKFLSKMKEEFMKLVDSAKLSLVILCETLGVCNKAKVEVNAIKKVAKKKVAKKKVAKKKVAKKKVAKKKVAKKKVAKKETE